MKIKNRHAAVQSCCLSGVLLRLCFALLLSAHSSLLSLNGQVVINEVHYDPPEKISFLEFVEIHNTSDQAVDISGWSFSRGISFQFPSGTTIPPRGFLVVAENPQALENAFGQSALGPFEGHLAGEGETVSLEDHLGRLMDEVDFAVGFPWPADAAGEGSSMELLNPSLDNDLGGSWRASRREGAGLSPTPGRQNSVYVLNAPPQVRQVQSNPLQPASNQPAVITAKITDPDGVDSVELTYQVVLPGNYIPAHLPLSFEELTTSPLTPLPLNPEFENLANWSRTVMKDDGKGADITAGDGIFSAVLPRQVNRTLVRYQIAATDAKGERIQVPYQDDPSLNFAYFVYDGVPAYEPLARTVHPDGLGHVYSAEVMRSLPTYMLITREEYTLEAQAYGAYSNHLINVYNIEARQKFNWRGTFVYEGVVYDHIGFRPRQSTGRYHPGKRALKFRFNKGHYLEARDRFGQPYPRKWREFNAGKLFDTKGSGNFGLNESMNSILWNLVGVPAPNTHHFHLRIIDQGEEAPAGLEGQYSGDFWGMYLAMEEYDSRFVDAHNLPDGNLYRLKPLIFDGNEIKKNQGRFSVQDDEDFQNIRFNLHDRQPMDWLRRHVNWERCAWYDAVCQAVRNDDYHPNDDFLKNRAWFFEPAPDSRLGKLWTLPWDSDTTWGPNWGGTGGYTRLAIFGGEGKPELKLEYRNVIREFRDLIWQEDVIIPLLDELAESIRELARADRDRWRGAPEGRDFGDMESKLQDMKNFAFVSWSGGSGDPSPNGQGAFLDALAAEEGEAEKIPETPQIEYTGQSGFHISDLRFACSSFADPQGAATFAGMEWRLGEVTDENAPAFDPSAPVLLEWNSVWTSGLCSTQKLAIQIPADRVSPGHAYRVRARMQDESGRWSHWSAPIQFIAELPENSRLISEGLRISEIMYHPIDDDLEFLELINLSEHTLDLSNVSIAGGITFDFRGSLVSRLEPNETVVVVRDLERFSGHYPEVHVAGEYQGGLSNNSDTIILLDELAGVVLTAEYRDNWFSQTDGQGFALVSRTQLAEILWNGAEHWKPGELKGGSPGRIEPARFPDPGGVIINEVFTPGGGSGSGWIELFNSGPAELDLSGWFLSDDISQLTKYRIPEGTRIHGFGYLLVQDPSWTLNLSGTWGGRIILSGGVEGALGGYRHTLEYSAARADASSGLARPDARVTIALEPTPGAPNQILKPGLLISEISYYSSETEAAEFIEIYNPAPRVFTCDNGELLQITGGISFTFPDGFTLEPGGVVLVTAGDPEYVRWRFNVASNRSVIGPFSGRLDDAGDVITVMKYSKRPGDGVLIQELQDSVTYQNEAPWPALLAGRTISLHRKHFGTDGNDPSFWVEADPSPGIIEKDVDTDEDGLPDEWETIHGLDPQYPGDLLVDSDGDLQSNMQEFLSGANPADPKDFLSISAQADGGRILIHWEGDAYAVPGTFRRVVSLERCAGAGEPWLTAFGPFHVQKLPLRIVQAIPPDGSVGLFRLKIWLELSCD